MKRILYGIALYFVAMYILNRVQFMSVNVFYQYVFYPISDSCTEFSSNCFEFKQVDLIWFLTPLNPYFFVGIFGYILLNTMIWIVYNKYKLNRSPIMRFELFIFTLFILYLFSIAIFCI